MTLIQTSPKHIYYGDTIIVSDMQGPCPDGFHVPLSSEWVALCGIFTSTFGRTLNPAVMGTYLKMPKAGFRRYSDANVSYVGDRGYYRACTPYNTDNAEILFFYSSYTYPQSYGERATGFSVRCFKDTPTIPTSSWATLYQGTGSAGVFWNIIDGLISVSGDGQTWYTIMDKNLGATTVYNQGDTLTDDNCGYFYQWGNNYGFPHSGSVTASSTKVDVTGYGPGNYYSSSTFITANPRNSTTNDNLRGGVTQGTSEKATEIKAVYLGDIQVRPKLPPYLCFTANAANSTIQLTKYKNPYAVSLETSVDGDTWSDYTIGSTITLTKVGDKIYWRTKSETTTSFSRNGNYYYFVMSGNISASGDTTSLINKNCTLTLNSSFVFTHLFDNCSSLKTSPKLPATSLTDGCYKYMFVGCTGLTTVPELPATSLSAKYNCYEAMFKSCISLTSAPQLPATVLDVGCYYEMFYNCSNLTILPSLPATTLADYCYEYMFQGCSKIKLSTTQTGDYQTAYRIPTSGTGSGAAERNINMFASTGGTFTGAPSINTTYYTSNTVV